MRIREETREALRELEEQTGRRTTDLLAQAVERLRRGLILDETNAAYAAMRSDATAWRDVDEERSIWDATLEDGLEEDDAPNDVGA